MHTHDVLHRGLTIVMLVTLLLLTAFLPGITVTTAHPPMEGYCACGPEDHEPNDSFGQAYGPLIPGQTYQSYISCCDKGSQGDYFYIDISTTHTINIDLTSIPAGVDYNLYLYNAAQVVVAQSEEDGNSPEHIPYNPPSAGKYYVLVSSRDSLDSTSPYSLQVTYDGCYGPDNYEPNDSCDQAYGPLTSGQTYQSWISDYDLTTYKESDYFFICSSGNNYISINLTDIPAGTDYDLFLYKDPSGDPDGPVAESRNYGNWPETIWYPPGHDPLGYYIRIYSCCEDYSRSSTSPYSLRVTYDPCPMGPTLYLPIIMKNYFHYRCSADDHEPNDSCEEAYGPLTSGQIYQSWISDCDLTTYKKSDYFYIDISTTNAVNIYLTNIPAGTDYDLYLYGNPSDDPNHPAAKSNGTGSSETISHSPLATGRYYIRVYSYSGYSTSPYSLRVTYD